MTDDISKVDNPWREFIENCIAGSNYFRSSEYRRLLADLDRLYRLESAATPAEPTLAEIERAVATLPPGYAFADALEHATPAGIAANIPNPLLDPIQGPATTRAEVDAPGIDTANHAGVRVRGYTVEQYATLARQLVEAKAANAIAASVHEHERLNLMSQLAEATRRLGEVEGLVEKWRTTADATWDDRYRGVLNDHADELEAALTKEPAK